MKRFVLTAVAAALAACAFGAGTASAACVPPYCPAPIAVTGAATAVAATTATLPGTVNPNGGGATAWRIELGTSPSSLATVAGSGTVADGTAAVPVSAAATGLTANTTYYFRVVAQNAGGTTAGATASFTTATSGTRGPAATTHSVSTFATITPTGVDPLDATVDPRGGGDTAWQIQVGTSAGSLTKVVASGTVPDGTDPVDVSGRAIGLEPGTKYFFRVSATNAGGTATGDVLTFTTARGTPPAPSSGQVATATRQARGVLGTAAVALTNAFHLGRPLLVFTARNPTSRAVGFHGRTITVSRRALLGGAPPNLFAFGSPAVGQTVTVRLSVRYTPVRSGRAVAAATRSVTLPTQRVGLRKGQAKPSKLKLPAAVRTSLRAGHRATVKATVTRRDTLGNQITGSARSTLVGARAPRKPQHPRFTG